MNDLARSSTDEATGRRPPVSVASDMSVLVVYDPALLQGRVKDPKSWYEPDAMGTDERRDGRLAAWPIGGKAQREYRVRLGAGLDPVEAPYHPGHTEPAPLRVEGGTAFVGPGERLPADGFGDRLSQIPGGGGLYPLAPGRYRAAVHVLDWRPDDRFWTEENEPTEDAPPDFVVVVEPVEGELPAAPDEVAPLLEYVPQKKAQASKQVTTGQTWLARHKGREVEERPQRKRGRASGGGRSRPAKKKEPIQVAEVTPGALCVGATVRHPVYGVGKVLFVRQGFPKAKVSFPAGEEKVQKDDLDVVS